MTERALAAALVLAGCGTHRPHAPDAALLEAPVEVRAAHGELVLELARRGPGGWDVLRPDGAPLHVEAHADVVSVREGEAVVLELHAGPTGLAGGGLRLVVPPGHGFVRVLDDIGVTRFSADPAPGGGTVGRDGSGTPILEAKAEKGRVVVDRPAGGERMATVHHLAAGPDATLVAALLAEPSLPMAARAAAAAYVLSR
jgi:hypothetical protein